MWFYNVLIWYPLGTLQACINAATMALIDAGIPMIDYVCASTAGCIDKQPVLGTIKDLNQNLPIASHGEC